MWHIFLHQSFKYFIVYGLFCNRTITAHIHMSTMGCSVTIKRVLEIQAWTIFLINQIVSLFDPCYKLLVSNPRSICISLKLHRLQSQQFIIAYVSLSFSAFADLAPVLVTLIFRSAFHSVNIYGNAG
jgi:hypothetical protein